MTRFQKLVVVAVLTMLLPMLLPVAHAAASVDSSIIRTFPKNAGEFGFADFSKARELPWFPQIQAQFVPVSVHDFDQFLQTAQKQQTTSIEQAAWSRVAAKPNAKNNDDGELVIAALGHFDVDAIQSFVQSHQSPEVRAGPYTLYPSQTGNAGRDIFFAILDPETIIFGPLEPLKRTLLIRAGYEENLLQNEQVMALIARANGDALFWDVLGAKQSQAALHQWMPSGAAFNQGEDLIGKLGESLVAIKTATEIQVNFQITAKSAADAVTVSELLQAGVLYKQIQSAHANPALAAVLDRLSVNAGSNNVEISVTVTQDQVLGLLESDLFAL